MMKESFFEYGSRVGIWRLLGILAEEGAAAVGGVCHAFSSGEETARKLLDLGFHLGFGGMVTFKGADNVRRALRITPLDRLLLETDSPYLTPVPYRGKRNEPGYLVHTATVLAGLFDMEPEEFAALMAANARRLFRVM